MPFFRFEWYDFGQGFWPDVADYRTRQALRLQADIEAYITQEWLPLKQGFADDAVVARELAPRVADYIHHLHVLNRSIEASGLEVQPVTVPLPAVADQPAVEGHGICVRFRPAPGTFGISTTFWLFPEARMPGGRTVAGLPELAAGTEGDDLLVTLIDALKYRLKRNPRTPLQEAFNTCLNGFIRANNLDTDPHRFATLPPHA